MKKWLCIFLSLSSLSFAAENEEETRAKELCSFTNDVFSILNEEPSALNQKDLEKAYISFVKKLDTYEKSTHPEIAVLAEKFMTSLKTGASSKESLGDAVSSLGRLLKCSVDDEHYRYDTSYVLRKDVVQKELAFMETKLGKRVPAGKEINYHKLMMESLAEKHYDLALYAYLKIAEGRCQG